MPAPYRQAENQSNSDHNMQVEDAETGDVARDHERRKKRMRIAEHVNSKVQSIHQTGVCNNQSELPEKVSEICKSKAIFSLFQPFT